jgi:nucleoside-diphosphate kinase
MDTTHPRSERSFVIVKPDGVQRGLIGEVVKRFERAGLKLVGMKFTALDEKKIWEFYDKDEAWFMKKGTNILEERKAAGLPIEKEALEYGKDIIQVVVDFMIAGPVVIMAWEGNQAVAVVKKLVGETEPSTSDVGTIRGDFTLDSYAISAVDNRAVRNLIHCSDKPAEAEREIGLWFKPEDLIEYSHINERILYDAALEGFKRAS